MSLQVVRPAEPKKFVKFKYLRSIRPPSYGAPSVPTIQSFTLMISPQIGNLFNIGFGGLLLKLKKPLK
jgi:hypothetical protein